MAVCHWCLTKGHEKILKISEGDLEVPILITALIQNKKELKAHKSCMKIENQKVANARDAHSKSDFALEFSRKVYQTLEHIKNSSYKWEGKDEVYLYNKNKFSLPLPHYATALQKLESSLSEREARNVSDPKVGHMYTFVSPQGNKARALCMRRLGWKVQGTIEHNISFFQFSKNRLFSF